MKINRKTREKGVKIIIGFEPARLFMFENDCYFIGIGNSTRDCCVEEFITEDLCNKW